MSDDRFYNQVRSTMANYQPEVPASVYGAMRKKLWWSNFTKLSATRFNIWYLGIMISGAVAAWAFLPQSAAIETAAETQPAAVPAFVQPVIEQAPAAVRAVPVTQTETQTTAVNHSEKKHQQPIESEQHTENTAEVIAPEEVNPTANTPIEETKSEAQQAKGGAKRGLKMKTYTDSQQKK